MEVAQALKVVMGAAERALLTKQDHLAVEQAYQVLSKALEPVKQPEVVPVQE